MKPAGAVIKGWKGGGGGKFPSKKGCKGGFGKGKKGKKGAFLAFVSQMMTGGCALLTGMIPDLPLPFGPGTMPPLPTLPTLLEPFSVEHDLGTS